MLIAQRHQKILDILEEKNAVTIEELKKYFSVSESTIRNDLRYLESINKLKRSHGGAIKIQKQDEIPFSQRSLIKKKEKEQIGKIASQFIFPNETIFLDAGTTVMELAKNLPNDFEFNVVTSALNTALAASVYPNVSVHLVGGLLRPALQELVGPNAVEGIRKINAQKVFLGASGLSLERGVTENHIFSAEVKKAMVESAEQVFLLIDSEKIGKSFFVDLIPLDKVDVLITDSNISDEYYTTLSEIGIKVIKA